MSLINRAKKIIKNHRNTTGEILYILSDEKRVENKSEFLLMFKVPTVRGEIEFKKNSNSKDEIIQSLKLFLDEISPLDSSKGNIINKIKKIINIKNWMN